MVLLYHPYILYHLYLHLFREAEPKVKVNTSAEVSAHTEAGPLGTGLNLEEKPFDHVHHVDHIVIVLFVCFVSRISWVLYLWVTAS